MKQILFLFSSFVLFVNSRIKNNIQCFGFFKVEGYILLIAMSFCSQQLYGQENKKIKTDTSIIEIKYFNYLNSMREFNRLNNENKIYYKDYSLDTGFLREEGVTEKGDCIGVWNFYSANGDLVKKINYSTGEIFYLNGVKDPYDSLFLFAKEKADSIVISSFGLSFFKNHISWNCSNSYYYGEEMSNRWFDTSYVKPSRFLLRYYLIFDASHKYSPIEFQLDSLGDFKYDRSILGLVDSHRDSTFAISYEGAIEIAKQHGLKIEKSNYGFYLKWIKPASEKDFKGDYEIEISVLTKRKKKGAQITYTYETVTIDPWKGKFKEKKEMTRLVHTHKYCNFDSFF